MKKTTYQQPTTEVVKLQQQSRILADSKKGLRKPSDYSNGGNPFTF